MKNFGDIPQEFANYQPAKVVILPIPYDGTSTWIKGADKGPEAIIDASCHMELYDIESDTETYEIGIFTAEPVTANATPDEMVKGVKDRVQQYIRDDKFVVSLGGEHSVSIGAIMAYAEAYPDLTVLQFDAHSDMRSEYEGSKYNHACIMARAKEVAQVMQIGIRSMDIGEKENIDFDRIVFAHTFFADKMLLRKKIEQLTGNVYLTIDLDVFDPAIMPSTGTPEPGGLFWYDVVDLIKEVNANVKIVGMDVVELCPNPENKAPNFLAAKLVYRILSMIFC